MARWQAKVMDGAMVIQVPMTDDRLPETIADIPLVGGAETKFGFLEWLTSHAPPP